MCVMERERGREGEGKEQQGSQEEAMGGGWGEVGWALRTKVENHGVTKVYYLLEAC